MDERLAIGVDLGATKIASALVARDGTVLSSRHTPTIASAGPAAVCDRIATEVRELMKSATGNLAGVGIGSPGLVDGAAGIVRGAVNLKWTEVPLAAEISRRLDGLPVWVENDANANALGEGFFGSARGCAHYLLLTLGSGLGSGVVSHGKLITGARFMASDLGHYSIDPEDGLPCACGHRGCAETVASGAGLVAAMQRICGSGEAITPARIIDAARHGDENALVAFAEVGKVIGDIAALAAAVIDPQVIVIGGGLGVASFDLIESAAIKQMSLRLPPTQGVPPLRVATLPNSAMGSACLTWFNLPGTRK